MAVTRGAPPLAAKRTPGALKEHNALICYARPFVWIMAPEMQQRGGSMIVARTPRIAPASVDPTIKNYHWGDFTNALFEAEDRGADYAVLLGPDGHVAECAGANLFAVFGDTVVSPGHGALEGITRRTVHELCDSMEIANAHRDMTAGELLEADEIFMASTAGGIMPIVRIEDRTLSNGAPGPLTRRLSAEYWARHEAGWHATPVDYAV